MKFLIDNQLPVSLAEFIRGKGFDCVHVIENKLDRALDLAIWEYEVKEGFVIVSKDEDFFHIAKTRPKAAQFIWVRLGNCRKADRLCPYLFTS